MKNPAGISVVFLEGMFYPVYLFVGLSYQGKDIVFRFIIEYIVA
jgi:hypothetical protein